jgi:nucleotide-binding universal stress UspA family protein
MNPITSILAATDFSPDGNNAVRRAARLAHEHGAHLHVLHVLKPDGCKPLREWFSPTIDIDLKGAQARAALRRVATEILGAYDVAASVEVVVGDPFTTLLHAAERFSLVVLGRRGHSRLETLLIGRTADRMIRTCRPPVLVVRQGVQAPYRQLLMPVDFAAGSDAVWLSAARLAGDAPVQVFHATDGYRELQLRRAAVDDALIRAMRNQEAATACARMRRIAARLGLDRARWSFSAGPGPAAPAALEQARTMGADLIVAGKQGRSTLGEFLLGSVSGCVLAGADCDVMIVPRPRGTPSTAPGGTPPGTRPHVVGRRVAMLR